MDGACLSEGPRLYSVGRFPSLSWDRLLNALLVLDLPIVQTKTESLRSQSVFCLLRKNAELTGSRPGLLPH